jgi:glucose-6-phosphate dehydrogenase assembly protein OpcA
MARLGIPVGLEAARELSAVSFYLADGTSISLRSNGNGTATLSRTGVSDRILPLVRRRLGEELAEELRRLDPDQPYGMALQAATGTSGLDDRPAHRTHIWRDPVRAMA